MKRFILLSVAIIFFSGNIFSQDMSANTPLLLNHKILAKKVAKSNEYIVNEKKSVKSSTWLKRAALFQDVDNQGLEQVQLGMDTITLKLFYQDPKSIDVSDDKVTTYSYETMNYLFENGRLRGWTRIDPIHENPLDVALESYIKGFELTEADKRMKVEEKYKKDLDELKTQFQRFGQNMYYLNHYNEALLAFEAILDVNKIEVYNGLIDTLMLNYSGIVAREIGRQLIEKDKGEEAEAMYRKTIGYYNQLADIGYGGASGYVQMTRDFYVIGDTLGAIENLKKGIHQYPDSSLLVTVAAQAYYLMGDNEGGIEFVNQRLKEKNDCPAAYYWKGLLITNKKDVDEDTIKVALAYYDTSLMYDPMNASVWYQSGYVNYAVGANYFEKESYEEDSDLRDEFNVKGKEYYNSAAEKLEKSYEIAGDDEILVKESLDLLKRIYYKLYGGEDERYIDVNKKLKSL